MNDQAICEELNSKGFRPARLKKLNPQFVKKIRITEGLYSIFYKFKKEEIFDGYMTMKGLSKKLGVSIPWVHSKIKSGKIKPMRHPVTGNYLVEDSPKLMEYLLKLKEKGLSRFRKARDKTISME